MTQKRQTTLQRTLLAIAMAVLVALSAAGPAACTPAAPAEQAAGQAEAEDATATADATNTPTPEPTATTAAASTPTPTATVATANSKVEPMLNALVTQSQSVGVQGAAGQTARMVGVVIDPVGATQSVFLANSDTIDRLAADNGGVSSEVETWTHIVPVSLLPQLSAHPGVAAVTAARPEDFPYPKLSRALNNAVAVWYAGATPQQAAAAYSALVYDDKILVFLDVSDSVAFNRVEAFFTTNKVYVAPERRESDLATLSMMVLVPIPLLASLSQVSGITEIEDAGLEPVSVGVSRSPEFREYLNLYLYGTLPPNLRSQLSPLPTEVWELEGITPTPSPTTAPTSTSTPTPSSGRVGDNPQLPTLNRVVMVKNRPAPDDDGSAFASLLIRPGLR